jgi:hypothetical protein
MLSLLAAGSVAGLGFAGGAFAPAQACPNNSQPSEQNTTTYQIGDPSGGIYTSGGDPTTNPDGYVGASGNSPAGNGYVEAGGSKDNPTAGYIVAADSTGTGAGIVGGTPGTC